MDSIRSFTLGINSDNEQQRQKGDCEVGYECDSEVPLVKTCHECQSAEISESPIV